MIKCKIILGKYAETQDSVFESLKEVKTHYKKFVEGIQILNETNKELLMYSKYGFYVKYFEEEE